MANSPYILTLTPQITGLKKHVGLSGVRVDLIVRTHFTIRILSVAETNPFKKRIAFSSSSLFIKSGLLLGFTDVLAICAASPRFDISTSRAFFA